MKWLVEMTFNLKNGQTIKDAFRIVETDTAWAALHRGCEKMRTKYGDEIEFMDIRVRRMAKE